MKKDNLYICSHAGECYLKTSCRHVKPHRWVSEENSLATHSSCELDCSIWGHSICVEVDEVNPIEFLLLNDGDLMI